MTGIKRALQLSVLVHFIAATFVVLAGIVLSSGLIYWIGAAFFIGLLVYQHAIIGPNDLSRVNLAFGTTNGIASVVFAIFVILSIYF